MKHSKTLTADMSESETDPIILNVPIVFTGTALNEMQIYQQNGWNNWYHWNG
jgi:hypothetical protein